jgi:hypothetical protein
LVDLIFFLIFDLKILKQTIKTDIMAYHDTREQDEIFSKVMRAGRRTYFFDVRATRAGDYYLTITESKKFTNDDGSFHYKKHKIYLYKEDFQEFKDNLDEMTDFVINEKGSEVISERHQKDFYKNKEQEANGTPSSTNDTDSFTDVSFEDI